MVVYRLRTGGHNRATAWAIGADGKIVQRRQDYGIGNHTSVSKNGIGAFGIALGDEQRNYRWAVCSGYPASGDWEQTGIGLEDHLRVVPVDRQIHRLRVSQAPYRSGVETVIRDRPTLHPLVSRHHLRCGRCCNVGRMSAVHSLLAGRPRSRGNVQTRNHSTHGNGGLRLYHRHCSCLLSHTNRPQIAHAIETVGSSVILSSQMALLTLGLTEKSH